MSEYNFQMALLMIKGLLPYALSRIEDMQDALPDGVLDAETIQAIQAFNQANEFLAKHR